ncbi:MULTISPECIES: TnsA-like heteromeric transposase endonuclease subunit [unclassified Streptomyces]|uniref:TnsA-like heteromeric transposase endonuclease subunit n=1 Tax=unclassified Streptomyces TaxID=2593676 RepID=UPI0018FE67E3|nr:MULTISPECIES: TnsA-like heteromeric transposase endonuclease subunit [unclassified Streptomyces]MCH0561480.1 TnsA-like heteromeric transposase endonuclease subunit [Streptomyces sp. MUM 16J]
MTTPISQALVRSDACSLNELIVPYGGGGTRGTLSLGEGWTGRWTSSWMVGDGEVAWPVRDLGSVPVLSSRPVRRFSWRARQGHRPGLQFMVSTGRHHAFESLEEQRLLLALDFLGASEVLPQPFRLDFDHAGGRGQHIPDFLAVMPGGMVLFDVRPGERIEDDDRLKFDAAAEAAASCGWQYVVVTCWRQHVTTVLDHLSSQRRPLKDQLGLQRQLISQVSQGPVPFGELVEHTSLPVVARAHATHLLWHRRLAVDLGRPLGDGSLVWLGQRGRP